MINISVHFSTDLVSFFKVYIKKTFYIHGREEILSMADIMGLVSEASTALTAMSRCWSRCGRSLGCTWKSS